MQNKRPFQIGVLAGAVSCAGVVLVMVGVVERSVLGSVFIATFAMTVSAVMATFVGIPAALWLRGRRRLSMAPMCLVGALCGAIAMGAAIGWANYWPQVSDQVLAVTAAVRSAGRGALIGGFLGLVSSVAFCLGSGIPLRSEARSGVVD